MNASADFDIGPLSWVKGEIDLALERAATELSSYAVTPASDGLKKARASLHQAHGALAIVGVSGIIEFAEAIEQLFDALTEKTIPDFGAAIIAGRNALAALRTYLDELMAGHPNQPIRLLASYQAMAAARGIPLPSPTDLFFPDLTQRPPRREHEPAPLDHDALAARLKAARLGFERGLLKWIKGDPKGIAEMKVSVSMIEATRTTPVARAYWWVSLGVLSALAANALPDPAEAKKFAMRLGARIKKLTEGETEIAESFLREALYHVATATGGGDAVEIVRAAYRLDGMLPSSTPSDAERLQPHLLRLRELLVAAKDDWNRLSAGTAAALPPFHERIAKIAEEGTGTHHPDYIRLTRAILEHTDLLRRDPSRHTEVLALEMATALLLAETALDNFDALDVEFTQATDAVLARLSALARNEELGALDVPHLDAISRRAQERLLLESVAREIRNNLGVVEQTLDAFFRDASRQHTLTALKQPIRQIEGALAVLGQERANAVLWECSQAIEDFARPGFQPRPGDFEDLAKKLSALGFFVEQLQHGYADIDEILEPPVVAAPEAVVAEPEPEPPAPAPAAAAEPALSLEFPTLSLEQDDLPIPSASPGDESLRLPALDTAVSADKAEAELAAPAIMAADLALPAAAPTADAGSELPDFFVPEPEPVPEPEAPAAAPPPAMATPAPSTEASRLIDASAEELDAELLGIFLEEAQEVLGTIAEHLPLLHQAPSNRDYLTTLRRSYHTLKGSGRMVGLTELGEAGWAVEQLLNRWLQESLPATPPLLDILDLAYEIFRAWVSQLEAGGSRAYPDALDLALRCEALREGRDEEGDIKTAAAPPPPAPVAAPPTPAPAPSAPSVIEDSPALTAAEQPADDTPPLTADTDTDSGIETDVEAVAEASLAPIDTTAEQVSLEFELDEAPPALAIEDATAEPAVAAMVAVVEEMSVEEVAAQDVTEKPQEEVGSTAVAEAIEAPPSAICVGDVEIPPTLYQLYLDESRSHVKTLRAGFTRNDIPSNELIRAAHTTASISAATGLKPIHLLAHAMEGALVRLAQVSYASTEAQRLTFNRCASALDVMLGEVAELRMPGHEIALTAELEAITPQKPMAEPVPEIPLAAAPVATPAAASESDLPEINLRPSERRTQRIEDEIDAQLLPLFLEESVDLMRDIGEGLRAWRTNPQDSAITQALQRALHTLKGSARMAGAMGCGELLHAMESRIDQAAATKTVLPTVIDNLETSYDRAAALIDHLRHPDAPRDEEAFSDADLAEAESVASPQSSGSAPLPATPLPAAAHPGPTAKPGVAKAPAVAAPQVHLRVRADMVDQLVNEAGEVAIARARVEGELRSIKTSLLDLTENVIRLRNQLREVEIQAESQMQSQQAMVSEQAQQFDPLEFDRFTRFQEVTRMMAESVNDVSTLQQGLLRNLDNANAALAAQSRLNRELSQRLMGVRMVPFDSLAERLHRVVRQAAKDAGKRANLDIRQGQTEIDRSVLDKMAGPIEHLLRNSVAHGLETRNIRLGAGKNEIGQITLSLAQEGNEIVLAIADDGAGLDLQRIRQRAVERGLLAADAVADDGTLAQMIFQSGFSTAENVTALSGRGVGMDVVRNETTALGGRIEIKTVKGQGTVFRIYLPLTLAVTQTVLISVGGRRYAIPSSMVEQASELKPADVAKIRATGGIEWLGKHYPWHYLAVLLGDPQAVPPPARRHWVLLVKGGAERVALEVDAMFGNQEIVVKAVGPQLARVPGLAGATVLSDGEVALILNPIALVVRSNRRSGLPGTQSADGEGAAVELYQDGDTIKASHIVTAPAQPDAQTAATSESSAPPALPVAPPAPSRPALIMIVDDSLTVRKISGRLLARHGYEVVTAKDGVDALEQLSEIMPDAMLVDIEMPRMDGFDLVRNIRADDKLRHIPVIMITSRTADKHRNHAMEIGVNHYMGKPYDEDLLLSNIAELVQSRRSPT